MLVTASSALRALGRSEDGRGGGLERCCSLYANAEVESSAIRGGLLVSESAWAGADEEAARTESEDEMDRFGSALRSLKNAAMMLESTFRVFGGRAE